MEILKHIHSILRWAILIFGIIVLIKSYIGFSQKKLFRDDINKWSLFLMISCHTTLIIGLLLYFFGAYGVQLFQNNPTSEVMKNASLRFFAVEHALINIIGIAVITYARMASKKTIGDAAKYKKLFVFTLIGFLLILSRIPWPSMQEVGRGWW